MNTQDPFEHTGESKARILHINDQISLTSKLSLEQQSPY
jgi:hypothetical protein